MIEFNFYNDNIGLNIQFPIEEDIVSELRGETSRGKDINPDCVKWILELEDWKKTIERINLKLNDNVEVVAESVLRFFSLMERSAARLFNKQWKDKEEFYKKLFKWTKGFRDPNIVNQTEKGMPPDIALSALGYAMFAKFETNRLKLEEEDIPYFLNLLSLKEEDTESKEKES